MGALVQNRPGELSERCLEKYAWFDNRLGQNPCEVARRLMDVCATRAYYPLPPLDLVFGQTHYPSPDPPQASSCQCSMGVYNLIQGCAACQQEGLYQSTLWTDWVSNCTMSNINGGAVFPYAWPADTEIPAWAWQNNADGALSVGQVFRNAYGGPPSNSSSSSSSSTSCTSSYPTTTAAYTELAGKHTVSQVTDGGSDNGGSSGSSSKIGTIVGVVVPLIVVSALVGAVFAYLRTKRRNFRRRGHRLDSSSDLPEHGVADVFGSGASASTAAYSGGLMKQKDSRVSVFARPAPSERSTARSFATNSVSTGVPGGVFNRESTLYTPSTGFDTMTRSSGFTYDRSDESYRDHEDEPLADDDSISPFSDIHVPAPSRVNTRNNIHTVPSSAYTASYSSFSLSASTTNSPSLLSHEADATSLLTTASSRGAPPSSTGATYGGLHDNEDEDAGSVREQSSLRR